MRRQPRVPDSKSEIESEQNKSDWTRECISVRRGGKKIKFSQGKSREVPLLNQEKKNKVVV